MRFLVDAQLPKRLAEWLNEAGHDALHALDLPRGNRTSDAELRNGDELVLEPLSQQARWAVRTCTGQIVGRTARNYRPPDGRIVTARVAAICVRQLRDVTPQWQSRMAVDTWEVVLPEMVIEPES